MADISSTFSALSSTESNTANGPSGSTVIATGLDDNLRMGMALLAAHRDQTGWGGINLTSVGGSGNTITATVATAGSVTYGPTALTSGMRFQFTPASTSTGAVSIAITSPNGGSSLGAKNIFAGNSALVGGELRPNIPVSIIYDGTQFQLLGPVSRQPTRTVLTSGSSATYTTPAGATRLNVRIVGGGGGGGGGGSGAANGTDGGNTSFSGGTVTLTANGGKGGGAVGGHLAFGGTASGGDINIDGADGPSYTNDSGAGSTQGIGPSGACSVFGGAGKGGDGTASATAAKTNSGSGGGAGAGAVGNTTGEGGAAGAYVEKLIVGPAATYTYTVGAAGGSGAGGTGGNSGGNGAAGIIIVDVYYN